MTYNFKRTTREPSATEHIASLALAARAKPTPEAGAAWLLALLAVLQDIAGGPGWQRCLPREGGGGLLLTPERFPKIFASPLWFLRAGAKTLDWSNVILVGRLPARPESAPVAATTTGIWWGEQLGLVEKAGRCGLCIGTASCVELPAYEFRRAFESLNPFPGASYERQPARVPMRVPMRMTAGAA